MSSQYDVLRKALLTWNAPDVRDVFQSRTQSVMVLLEADTFQNRVCLGQRDKLELGRIWKIILLQNLFSFLRLLGIILGWSDGSGKIWIRCSNLPLYITLPSRSLLGKVRF